MHPTATGSTAEGLEYGSVKATGVDVWGDVVVVVVRLVVTNSAHDATVLRVEFDEIISTPVRSNFSRAGAGRDDQLRIDLYKRVTYCSATAVRSSDLRKTISRPAGKTNGGVGPVAVATCGGRATASRLLTVGVESATAMEATACTRGSEGGGSKNSAT